MVLIKWSVLFLILALVAAVFGFGNIAAGAVDIARILFGLFVVIFIIMIILGLTVYKTVTPP
jgi:uncharacterized membrane protein YtjA (UPF0391 family)